MTVGELKEQLAEYGDEMDNLRFAIVMTRGRNERVREEIKIEDRVLEEQQVLVMVVEA